MKTITINDVKIINDIDADLRPGMFVTAQLGNEFDTSWSPCAPLLLLHTNVVFFGDIQFTGLYQRKPGEYYVARFVQKHHNRKLYEMSSDTELPVGVMYCTSAVPVNITTKSSSYLSVDENAALATALDHHREKVAKLPVIERYRKGTLLDPSQDY